MKPLEFNKNCLTLPQNLGSPQSASAHSLYQGSNTRMHEISNTATCITAESGTAHSSVAHFQAMLFWRKSIPQIIGYLCQYISSNCISRPGKKVQHWNTLVCSLLVARGKVEVDTVANYNNMSILYRFSCLQVLYYPFHQSSWVLHASFFSSSNTSTCYQHYMKIRYTAISYVCFDSYWYNI